jgi:hypothetical protein
MKLFEYEKWFFDVYTSDHAYFIMFISKIDLAGTTKLYLQMHGSKEQESGAYKKTFHFAARLDILEYSMDVILTRQGKIDFSPETINMTLANSDFSIELTYNLKFSGFTQQSEMSIRGRDKASLSWKPVYPNAWVNGSFELQEQFIHCFENETGYSDYVHSTFLPFRIPVKALYWGRTHAPETTLTYSMVQGKSGEMKWGKVYLWHDGQLFEFEVDQVKCMDYSYSRELNIYYPDKYSIVAKNPGSTLEISVYNHREMIINDFIGDATYTGRLALQILRKVTKNPRGIKFMAAADIKMHSPDSVLEYSNLSIIDEYGVF